MLEKPLVSVLMGVYQIEKIDQFSEVMEGLLNQTYSNIEILICDDGSTDGTKEILEKWAVKDERIKILSHEKNQGLAEALNTCIGVAQGTYLARQDADDISLPVRLEKQIAFLEKHSNIDFLGTNVELYDESGVWGKRRLNNFPIRKNFLFSSPFVHGTIVFRTKSLKEAGGYYVCKRTYRSEDYDLFMHMYSLDMQGANLQDFLYLYREDKDNMSKRKYHYRFDEARTRYIGFKKMGLMPGGMLFVLKPFFVGLLPDSFLFWLKCKFHIFEREK